MAGLYHKPPHLVNTSCVPVSTPGDLLRTHDGRHVPVESVRDAGETATVYNVRIEEYHTYFVGSPDWCFSLWVHNASYLPEEGPANSGPGRIRENAAQGAAWEQAVLNDLQATQTNVVQQITVRTPSGVRTRLDFLGNDVTGAVIATEAKSSATAPLTIRQTAAFPEIQRSGAIVVGAGKPPFVGGTQIPPETVIIRRP
jgi:filamentous hemagglutinin